ncbi:ER oxidoreductin Ecym_8157 [Eremothecium cymbalariae DBVPG|uniref:Endoplasmic oxidoreductin-1 n=1 Tax=Eremothecium cymbalariae (strain CBS 270.75 / DBVPG 7215 / KCTC 17166 / NRRL Y-17582) TaxID=931890 RepID=G8JX70_ERECY|nr:Hypothetical protein Ecym_8157 [Eremothecium cymbalariae DBVPG\
MKLWYTVIGVVVLAGAGLAEESRHAGLGSENGMMSGTVHGSANFCKMDKDELIGSTCDTTLREINEINSRIRPDLERLIRTDFFKYFKLDLYKECPFWDDNGGYCVNRACAVDVVEDWDRLPDIWQPEALGGLDEKTVKPEDVEDDECAFMDELCSREISSKLIGDIDYCDVDDFTKEGSVLVDLTANPERFTGYGGEQSSQIWSAIYKENCFTLGERGLCLAKDVFYRLVSGLHASIAAHLSNDYMNTVTGKWGPNLELFMTRVGNFPERVSNIYFNFAVVAKALWKIQPYLEHIDSCTAYDNGVKSMINNVVSQLHSSIFNEDLLFQDDFSSIMKDDFRTRFKNVTKIMDCVHCDRCRMWGKVQTTGYATSLKILFEIDSNDEERKQHVVDKLTKYEVIALFNTFDRISKSVAFIANFEKMYNERLHTGNNESVPLFQTDNFFELLDSQRNLLVPPEISLQDTNAPPPSAQSLSDDEELNKFVDIKLPPKSVKNRNGAHKAKGKWRTAWEVEIGNIKEALRFIWKSYVNFPRNICKIILVNMNRWFNKFIGVTNYLDETEHTYIYF